MVNNDYYLLLLQEQVKHTLHSRLPGSSLMPDGIIEVLKIRDQEYYF